VSIEEDNGFSIYALRCKNKIRLENGTNRGECFFFFMSYRTILILFSFFFLFHRANSQTNLVPNWSFEDTISCPQAQGFTFFSYTPPWFSPNKNTPDIYNTCSTDNHASVPSYNGGSGFQYAKTGNGFAGLATFDGSNHKEYLSIKLTENLKGGEKYCISFYVNFLNNSYFAIDAIGAYLSSDSMFLNNYSTIHVQPQVENPIGNVMIDTLNWTLISGDYIALGGEQYITIGDFKDDTLNTVDTIPSGVEISYYNLDDVSVYYCGPDTTVIPPSENQLTIPNAFTPNNDSYNDKFTIKGQNIKSVNGKIFNRWGKELFSFSKPDDFWDGKYKGNDVSGGVYFYVVTVTFDNGEIQEKHGCVELIPDGAR
jgi:gliding motility-associated-like protein